MFGVTEEEVPRVRQCCSDACVLGYVSMSDELNINGVEHSILCDWEDPGYTWKDEIHLVWENTGQVCNDSGKRIYFRIYCDWKT